MAISSKHLWKVALGLLPVLAVALLFVDSARADHWGMGPGSTRLTPPDPPDPCSSGCGPVGGNEGSGSSSSSGSGGGGNLSNYGAFWRNLGKWMEEREKKERARARYEAEKRRNEAAQSAFSEAAARAKEAAGRGEHATALRLLRAARTKNSGGAYHGLRPEFEIVLFQMGLRFADQGDFVSAKIYLNEIITSGRWYLLSEAEEVLRQIQPYAEQQSGGRGVVDQALRQRANVVPNRSKAAQEAWERKSRRLANEVMGESEARPAGPEEKGFLGGKPEVKPEESGLTRTPREKPSKLTLRQQLDAAASHGGAADAAAKDRIRQKAHREASRVFDRHGEESTAKAPVPLIGDAGAVIVDTRGVTRHVPERLTKRKDWLELGGEETQLRTKIGQQQAKIAAMEKAYHAQKDKMRHAMRGREAVRIAMEKQKESADRAKLADVKRQQEEMLDSFSVDFTERKDSSAKTVQGGNAKRMAR